jgi:phosphoserine phosphatase
LDDKKHLICVDFDRTLLTTDSGQEYLKLFATKRLRFFAALRILRLISKSNFRNLILEDLKRCRNLRPTTYTDFINHLTGFVNFGLLQFLSNFESSRHLIVINSASEEVLVEDFGRVLGFTEFIGSTSQNQNYGMKKIHNMIDRYPRSDFTYCTGVSDNLEDRIWDEYFENFIYYKSNTVLESNQINGCL